MRCHGIVASVALLVLVAGSAEADRKAEKLLQRAEAVTRKTRSLQATLRDVANGTIGTLRLAKPRSIYLALPGKDGDQSVVVNRGEDLLMIDEASSSGSVSEFEFLFEFGTVSAPITLAGCFFDPLIYRSFVQPSYAGTVARNSATYEVVKCPPSFGRGAITLYFGPSGLPEGIEIAALQTAEMIAAAQNIWLEDLRLNVRLPASAFTYASSRNVKVNPEKSGLTKF